MELYRKYRPVVISDIVGQPEAVKVVSGWVHSGKIPHTIMFDGPSGVGKTTFARCLANELGATDILSYREMNVAVERGVAMVEDLIDDASGNISGGNRVWVLDEIQATSKAAQNSLLKVTEESPDYAYFVFCTTDTAKILPALLNRCSRVTLKAISNTQIEKLVHGVAKKEGVNLPDDVATAIALKADGSARASLVLLEQALAVTSPEDMLAVVNNTDGIGGVSSTDLRTFWRTLFSRYPKQWFEVVAEFDKVTEQPESIRRATLAALGTMLRRGRSPLSADVLADLMRIFQFGLEDSGRDGLLLMVYDAWERINRK